MYYLLEPYLFHFEDIVVHKEKMLMLGDNKSVYDLKTHKKILELDKNIDVAALKNDNLIVVAEKQIQVISLKSKKRVIVDAILTNYSTAIYYDELLVIGSEKGEIYIFDEKFNLLRVLRAVKGTIPILTIEKMKIIAVSYSGELIIYDYKNDKLTIKQFNTKLTAMATQITSQANLILLGDENGFIYFVNEDLSYNRIRISHEKIEYLYFHGNIYCITEGFPRKINREGARKIYGTVCSVPRKIFSCNNKVFCTSLMLGVQPLVDRKNDFYDRIMKFQ